MPNTAATRINEKPFEAKNPAAMLGPNTNKTQIIRKTLLQFFEMVCVFS
jgi:hypothetical protein